MRNNPKASLTIVYFASITSIVIGGITLQAPNYQLPAIGAIVIGAVILGITIYATIRYMKYRRLEEDGFDGSQHTNP